MHCQVFSLARAQDGLELRIHHGHCLAAAEPRNRLEVARRSRVRRSLSSSLVVHGCLYDLRCRARTHLPSTAGPQAQDVSPHCVGSLISRCSPHDLRRQLFEPLVVPPMRLMRNNAVFPLALLYHFKGRCSGHCPGRRADGDSDTARLSRAGRVSVCRGVAPCPV